MKRTKTTKNKEKISEFNFKAAKNEEYFLISNSKNDLKKNSR
jgi:hypothetical protein